MGNSETSEAKRIPPSPPLNLEPDPKQTERGREEDRGKKEAKAEGNAEQAASGKEADALLPQTTEVHPEQQDQEPNPNRTESTGKNKADTEKKEISSVNNPNNLSPTTLAGLGHFQKIWELLAEIFKNISPQTDGDELEASIKLKGVENQSISPDDLLKKYQEQISPPYQGLEIGDLQLSDKDIGTSLGSKKCATYACKLLGIEPPIPVAQDLYFKLYSETKNELETSKNLIKDWNQLKAGDVVFFHSTYDNGRTITHTGVIIDDNFTMRHHPTEKKGIEDIKISSSYYWQKHFYAAIRPNKSQKTDGHATV